MSNNYNFFWIGMALWNFMMAITFLSIGIVISVINEDTSIFIILALISLIKCFIFGLCINEVFKNNMKGGDAK